MKKRLLLVGLCLTLLLSSVACGSSVPVNTNTSILRVEVSQGHIMESEDGEHEIIEKDKKENDENLFELDFNEPEYAIKTLRYCYLLYEYKW